MERGLDPSNLTQRPEALNGCHSKSLIVVVEVNVLRYPAPLNHLAYINPRSHARNAHRPPGTSFLQRLRLLPRGEIPHGGRSILIIVVNFSRHRVQSSNLLDS
jgi:hypothetical protein